MGDGREQRLSTARSVLRIMVNWNERLLETITVAFWVPPLA